MDSATTIKKIVSVSGKTEQEVQSLIDKKTEKFSGLLTEDGAALMVAKELGVELGLEQQSLERLQISQLKEGMNNVELAARIKHVFSPKKFEKNGRKGIFCKMVVADKSGEISLTAWNEQAKKIEKQGIEKGNCFLFKNCYVGSYRGRLQLNLSYNGSMQPIEGAELPEIEERKLKLAELEKGESDVSVVCRVLSVFPEKTFEREQGEGRVVNFMVGDGSGVLRATAWDEMVDLVKKLKRGEAIKIEGAYTKQGLKGVELHLGYRARVLRGAKEAELLPSIEKIRGIELKKKKISELQEKDSFIELNVEIREVLSGNLRFNVCEKCGKKVEAIEGKYLCDGCGEVKPDIRAVLGLKLGDESGEINAALFGEVAEKAIGLSKEELKKRLGVNTAEQIIAELREKLVGKKVKVNGFARMNSYSKELEFSVKGIDFL